VLFVKKKKKISKKIVSFRTKNWKIKIGKKLLRLGQK
jgi:hypothetical protein